MSGGVGPDLYEAARWLFVAGYLALNLLIFIGAWKLHRWTQVKLDGWFEAEGRSPAPDPEEKAND